jgi:hypothetical protein
MKPMIWVARVDGKGWNSNRIRDVVDAAFTISKPDADNICTVTIRGPWDGDVASNRARKILGRVCFQSHQITKASIETRIKSIEEHASTLDVAGRTKLLLTMLLEASLDRCASLTEAYIMLNGTYTTKSSAITLATKAFTLVSESEPVVELEPTPVETMTTKIEEVKVVTEDMLNSIKYGDPAPAGYSWIGDKLVKQAWPV